MKKIRKHIWAWLTGVFLGLVVVTGSGCKTSAGSEALSYEPAKRISNATDEIVRSEQNIESSARNAVERINQNKELLDQMRGTELSEQQQELVASLISNNIWLRSAIPYILDQAVDIKIALSEIRLALPAVQALETTLKEEREQLESKQDLFRILTIMFAIGGIAIAAGIVLSFYNPRLGIMVAGIGLILTAVAAGGVYYLKWIAIMGIVMVSVGVVIAVGFLIWSLRQGRVDREVAEVNTELLEMTKQDLPEESKKQIFGDGLKPGAADNLQSAIAKKRIQQIRTTKIKPKAEKTIQ